MGTAEETPTARARHTLDGLRRRMEAIRATGPVDHALAAGMLAMDVTDAYRAALLSRDVAAARLHAEHDWSYFALARVIHGDGAHAHRVHRAVESVTPPDGFPTPVAEAASAQADLHRAQAEVLELRALLTNTRRLAEAHISGRADPGGGWPDLGLPADPAQRVRAIAEQVRLIDSYQVALTAARNLAAASLVENAGWPVPEVAALARTSPSKVTAARDAVPGQLVSYADPGNVVEVADVLDALAGRAYTLGEMQDEAMNHLLTKGMPSAKIAALGQVPQSHVDRLRPGKSSSRPQIDRSRVRPRRTPPRHAA